MSEHAAVLFANEAFYVAFACRDYEAMDSLWSRRHTATCIHPGWSPLIGREEVMQSWQAILGNPTAPQIACHHPRAFVHDSVAYVLCYEAIGQQFLAATNVLVRENGEWKLIHHQAGASPAPTELEDEASTPPIQ